MLEWLDWTNWEDAIALALTWGFILALVAGWIEDHS